MFALTSAVGDVGGWTLDEDRSACESMHPLHYVESNYYEHWLHGLEMLLQRHGLASAAEIASGRPSSPAKPVRPTLAADVWSAVTHPGSYRREAVAPARFAIGDKVRTRNIHPHSHTRLPRYLRGHAGQIVAIHGAHVFPDSNATGRGEDPQWLYTVRFSAAKVWGSPSRDQIHADLWEPYLEAL
jgi:nitrile hydratase